MIIDEYILCNRQKIRVASMDLKVHDFESSWPNFPRNSGAVWDHQWDYESMGDLQDPNRFQAIFFWGYSLKFRTYIKYRPIIYGIGTSNFSIGSWPWPLNECVQSFPSLPKPWFSDASPAKLDATMAPRFLPRRWSFLDLFLQLELLI